MKILALEPYYGGSHRAFLDDLARQLPVTFALLTLPARNWKLRMRLAAPYFASRLRQWPERDYDLLFCSSLVDVATLRGLLPEWARRLPIYTYFHENQFLYPVQVEEERDLHFALTNLTTALASDRVAFNSRYNRDSFLAAAEALLAKNREMPLGDFAAEIREKSTILHPALDFSRFPARSGTRVGPPVVVWNHRWEHDKNPEEFFQALLGLAAEGREFGVLVLGESFRVQPEIFAQAKEALGERILHFGYLPARADYLQWLGQGDLVVSTARHEFYGLAVLEAMRAGCRPLLPRRLSYPELVPDEYLYNEGELAARVESGLAQGRLLSGEAERLTQAYGWEHLGEAYRVCPLIPRYSSGWPLKLRSRKSHSKGERSKRSSASPRSWARLLWGASFNSSQTHFRAFFTLVPGGHRSWSGLMAISRGRFLV